MILLLSFLAACGQEGTVDEVGPIAEETAPSEELESNQEDKPSSSASETISDESNDEKGTKQDHDKSNDPLKELKVHYIDVGQGDATLLQYADAEQEYNILFDTGDWQGNEVVPYLQSQNVHEINLVAVSHPDADHIGQLADVMEIFEVGEVWLSGNESSSDTFQTAITAVLDSNADYAEPRAGDSYQIGPMQIDVLYPFDISGNTNEESIALKFTYGDIQFLFTGDAGVNQEKEMMQSGDVSAHILHLGHHGSDTSSDPAFIDAINPDVAVYSAGEGNSYGHPSSDVVSRIQSRGIDLYGTDTHGTIIVTTDGKEVRISTEQNDTISPESTASSSDESISNDSLEEESSETKEGDCVDINTASLEEVQEITHIGPERAQDLIEQRPYQAVSDLDKINGIGPARITDIEAEGIACIGG